MLGRFYGNQLLHINGLLLIDTLLSLRLKWLPTKATEFKINSNGKDKQTKSCYIKVKQTIL